jgi:hypothetical protein
VRLTQDKQPQACGCEGKQPRQEKEHESADWCVTPTAVSLDLQGQLLDGEGGVVEMDVGSMERSMERMELPRSRTAASQRAPWLLRGFGLQDAARRHALSPTP